MTDGRCVSIGHFFCRDVCGAWSFFVILCPVMKYGFDNEKYLRIQSEHIRERIAQFGNKLYLELGGKLFDDFHAKIGRAHV